MNSKSSNAPSSSDFEISMLGENKSKPNSGNTIEAVKCTDCQNGANNMPLEGVERAPFSKMPLLSPGVEIAGNSSSIKPPLYPRPVIYPGVEKSGNSSSINPSQYPRQRTNEYIRSRLGPPEGLRGVNASSQLGNSSKKKGQVFDDRKELMTAAASAHSARQQACSDPLWQRMETVFAPVTTDDVHRVKQSRNAALLNAIQSRFHYDERIKNIIMKANNPRTEQSSLEQGLVSSAKSHSGLDIANTGPTVPSLFQSALSAWIDENEIEPPLEGIRSDGFFENNIFQSELDGHMINPSSFSTNEQSQADDEAHVIRELKNCNGLDIILPSDPNAQMPQTASVDDDYQMFSLDDKLLLELQSLDLGTEMQPHSQDKEGPFQQLHSEDKGGEIHQEIKELQEKLQQQIAPIMQNELTKMEKAIEHEQSLEKRATEGVAFDKLVEIAYEKMPLRGRITQPSTRNRSKTSTKKDLAFVERTLQRYEAFEETGRSCFSDPNLQNAMFPAPPSMTDKENIQQNRLIVESAILNGVSKRRKTRPSASNSDSGVMVEKKKRKTSRVQTVVRPPPPPSNENEGGNITPHLPDTEEVVSHSLEPVNPTSRKGKEKVDDGMMIGASLTSRKGKEKVNDGMLVGASEIISEQSGGVVEGKRRYRKRTATRISNLVSNSSSSVVAPINTEESLTGAHNQPISSTTVLPQNVAKCGETSAARVKKVDGFFSKDFEKLCMEKDYDILLQASELDNLNDVGKPEDLKTFIDFLEEDPNMDFTCPLDVPLDDLFDVDAALAKGW